jgi:hypothetical protein
LDLANKPPDGAEGVAAKIKQDEANAKKRRAAVRYLGTVDCVHWPEARDALVGALRGDTNECVRLEAALALGSGCCCNKKTIKALAITVAGTDEDGFPRENCERVRVAAVGALEHCLACFVEIQTAPPAPEIRPGETPPVPPGELPRPRPALVPSASGAKPPEKSTAVGTAKPAAGPVKPSEYYRAVQSATMQKVLADARAILEKATRGSFSSSGQALRDHSLTGIFKNAINGPEPSGVVPSPEPPPAVAITPAPALLPAEADAAKPAAKSSSSITFNRTAPDKAAPQLAPAPSNPRSAVVSEPKLEAKAVVPATIRVESAKPAAPLTAPLPPTPRSTYGVTTGVSAQQHPPTPAAEKQPAPVPVTVPVVAPTAAARPLVAPAMPQSQPTWPAPTFTVPASLSPAQFVPPAVAPISQVPAMPALPVPPSPPGVTMNVPRPVAAPIVVARADVPVRESFIQQDDSTPPRITLPVLLGMLKASSVEDREWAASQLAILPARRFPQAVQALQQGTGDREASVRLACLNALAVMNLEPGQLYTAAAPLSQDPDGHVRTRAYEELRRLGMVR